MTPMCDPYVEREWDLCGRPVVNRVKAEILNDMNAGRVPATVTTFAQLHDHVDANEYGGACEPDEDGVGWWDGDESDRERCMRFWNRMQREVDAWLRAGRPAR